MVLLVSAGCSGGGTEPAATPPEPPRPAAWVTEYSSPVASSAMNYLAVAKDAVWALGQETPAGSEVDKAVLLRLTDGKWVPAEPPREYAGARDLANVSLAASPESPFVWLFAKVADRPRAWRWDGSQWQTAPAGFSPVQVLALGPDDIWAIDSVGQVVRHWDGLQWKGQTVQAVELSAVAPDSIWAAGYLPGKTGLSEPALWHFDGQTWQRTPTPSYDFPDQPRGNESATLDSVVPVAPDRAWAFGLHHIFTDPGADREDEKIVLQWDGSRWTKASQTLYSWPAGPDGAGGIILPEAGLHHPKDGADRVIQAPPLLPGESGKVSAADKAQKLTAREVVWDPVRKTTWVVGYIGTENSTAFSRGVLLRFDPGHV